MNEQILTLIMTSASIAFLHTLVGPDHYLPFIVLSKARNWTLNRTVGITLLCGIGHVGGTILLGMLGLAIGIGSQKIEFINATRADVAAWGLFFLGVAYMLWGVWKARKHSAHKHFYVDAGGNLQTFVHSHEETKAEDNSEEKKVKVTPWILFIVFVLGPCESMIPLLMYPAARHSTTGVIMVSLVFSVITVLTMTIIVILSWMGLKVVNTRKLERYMHAIAGGIITLSAASILFLGL